MLRRVLAATLTNGYEAGAVNAPSYLHPRACRPARAVGGLGVKGSSTPPDQLTLVNRQAAAAVQHRRIKADVPLRELSQIRGRGQRWWRPGRELYPRQRVRCQAAARCRPTGGPPDSHGLKGSGEPGPRSPRPGESGRWDQSAQSSPARTGDGCGRPFDPEAARRGHPCSPLARP